MKTRPIFEELGLDISEIKEAAMVYRALNHKLRQRIISLLHKNKRVNVGTVYHKLGLGQSEASSHLGILRKVGVVISERDSRCVYYSLNYERLKELGGGDRESTIAIKKLPTEEGSAPHI